METIIITAPVRISTLEGTAYVVLQDGTQQPVTLGQILPAGTELLVDTNTQINYMPVAEGEVEPAVADSAGPVGEVSALQAAILAGFDPTELFAAPAAGPGGGGPVGQASGGSGNGGFVTIDRVGGFTQPLVGFDTNFSPISFENVDLIQPEDVDSEPEITIIFDPPLTPSDNPPQVPDGDGFVEESALPGGSNSGSDNESCSGNFDIDTGTDALARLEIRLANGEWVDMTGGGVVAGQYGTLTVTLVEGVYQWRYELNGPADHPGIDKTADDDILKDNFEVRVTDDDGDQASAGFTVNVLDDGPIASDDSFQVGESGLPSYNLVLVIDTSGSMGWIIDGPGVPGQSGVNGSPNRLELAKEALINLINSYKGIADQLNISVIDFGSSVKNSATNMSVEEAIAHINSLTAGGNTNYTDPLENAQDILTAQLNDLPEYQHKVYFLSDGYPNAGTAPAGWQVFVDENGIDVIAVGISIPESAVAELDKVGNSGDTTLVIKDPEELDDALQDTVPAPTQLSGNVLANDVSGADGILGVISVAILVSDASAYEGLDQVTIEDQGDGTFLVTYAVPESGTVEITTELGSTLTIGRDGEFSYSGPANVDQDTTETFTYTMADKDGDTSSADLKITVKDEDNGQTPPPDGNGGNNDDCPPITHSVDDLSVASAPVSFLAFWNFAAADSLLIDMGDVDTGINLSLLTSLDGVLLERQDIFSDGQYLGERLTAYLDDDNNGKADTGEKVFFTLDMNADGRYDFNLITPNPDFTASRNHGAHNSDDQLLEFKVSTIDCDGNVVSSQFSITIDGDTQHLTGTIDGEEIQASAGNKAYIQGLGGNDTLIGADENDVLAGGDGDDILQGEGGDDILMAGLGNNTLIGGEGNDVFVINQAQMGSLNIISDFEKGVDTLDLRDLLVGEQNGALSDYLNVAKNGNDTLFTLSPGGDGGQLQQIQLQGVDLMNLYGASDSGHLLQLMQEDQSLVIDK